MNNNELYHYGVLGMKWGVRRKRTNTSDNTDNKKRSKNDTDNNTSTDNSSNKKKGLSDKQKKAIKIGAAVAGAALATYGAYKVSKYVKGKNAVNGKRYVEQMQYLQKNIKNTQSHIDPARKLYKSDRWRHSFESTLKDRRMGIKGDHMLYGIDPSKRNAYREARGLMYDSLVRGDWDKKIEKYYK